MFADDAYTIRAAGETLLIEASSPLVSKIAAAKVSHFKKIKRLQALLGRQQAHVKLRALVCDACNFFRLPSRQLVALPQEMPDLALLFYLGINTIIMRADPSQKESSRISWNQFYEKIALFREEGFKVALQFSHDSSFDEVQVLKTHFDFLLYEEGETGLEAKHESLHHEKILAEIQLLEKMGMPILYFLKKRLHPKALFQLAFSVRADTVIAFEAVKDGELHPFFQEAASHAVITHARLLPLFSEESSARVELGELMSSPLFGVALRSKGIPSQETPEWNFLSEMAKRLWRTI